MSKAFERREQILKSDLQIGKGESSLPDGR